MSFYRVAIRQATAFCAPASRRSTKSTRCYARWTRISSVSEGHGFGFCSDGIRLEVNHVPEALAETELNPGNNW